MKTEKFKKGLSLFLAVLMLLSMMPAMGFIPEAEAAAPVMKATNAASSNGYYKYYDKITTITFLDSIDVSARDSALEKWDMSADGDGSVWSWANLDEEATAAAGANRYEVYVAGEGGVAAHENSTHFFYVFKSLKEIRGMENFHTGNVKSFYFWFGNCNELETVDLSYLDTSSATTFELFFYGCFKLKEIDASSWNTSKVTTIKNMFQRCYALENANLGGWDTSKVTNMYGVFDMNPHAGNPVYSLKSVNLSGWDTSNVTTMENMFRNCENLRELDLSSFNTSKVTTMRFMFYYCKNLKYIYAGEGWTTEAIANINDGIFNCCYALVGQKDNQDENIAIYNEKHPSAYYPPSVEYAKFREDGGYLENASNKPQAPQYTVTYKFIGDIIPEGVTAPAEATFEEGTTVTVADSLSVDKYIFSGWSTDDATVENGEFVISNDVEFVGSWTKLYQVKYEYDDNYELPAGAPEIPDTELWFAPGEDVPVYGIPYVPEYIFVGWNTGDAEVVGDSFIMPENDVVLYGYYKKPVNSIEISGGELTVDIGGEKVKVEVIIDPPDATFDGVIYESGDESIVTVDKDGYLEPVGVGTTTITITSVDDPTKTDTVNVTVKIPVTDITVDRTEIDLNKGDTNKITVTEVKPAEATNKEVTYESSDESVVKVDENGNIIAVGDGTATITVTSKDNKTVKEKVTVTVKTPVTEITVPEKEITLNIGDEKNVEAKTNEDATNKELIYESSNPGVAKIDNDGNVIAVGEGTATITVTSKDDPTKKETVTVTVKVPVTDIEPEDKEITLTEGDKDTVKVTVTPDDATNKELTFESSNEDVVKVDEDGNIEAVGEGTAIITVTSKDDPSKTETVKVTVNKKIFKVTYAFVGEVIPDKVTAPAMKEYKDGTKVKVEDNSAAEGYTFSGWTTDDATVENDEFTITKDVHFIGSWTKINYYKVTYKYEGDVPAAAPAVPDAKNYEEGKTVTVSDVPSVEGYTFIGWTTDDADVKDGKFTINNNVEFIGKWVKNPVHVTDITVEKKEITLTEGDKDKIIVTVTPDDADNKEVTFESSDETVVKVDENGNIEAVGEGEATITVTSKDDPTKKETVTVKVEKPFVPVTDITVEKNEFTLEEGEKDTIKVTVTPDDADNKEVTFESSDETVVKVDENGNIEAVGEGEATITVTSKDDPTKKETVTVKVEKPHVPVTDITVEKDSFTLTEGDKDTIKVTVKPDDATDKGVTYESSDETVVKVDEKGNIEAVGEGEATITVTSKDDPTKKETVTVKVEKPHVPVTDITVEKDSFTLTEGDKDTIKVTVKPDDATDKGVTYESSDETVVKVDEKGNIEAVGEGEATITVTSKDDPTKKETVTVKVEKPHVPVTDITVEKKEITLTEGEKDTIKVTVTPGDADNKEVTFESSDETVVKVDEKGNIEAVGEGEATITVTSKDDPTKKETVTVKVEKPHVPVTDITVEKDSFTLTEGDKDTIKVTVKPDDATDKGVTYESSDETVVKVDENGNIEAVGEGEATITVTSKDDPTKKETVTVKVEKKEEPEQPDTPDEPEKPEYTIEVADKLEVKVGITELIYVKVTPDDGSLRPTFSSADESIAKVDEFGNVTGISAGTTTIYVSFPNGEIRAVTVIVPAVIAPGIPSIPKTHHVCFGKTDGIGWYEVSINGGDFFPQGPNSTLEVQEGSILVVRVQDMWIDDEFDFYVNGSKVPMDPANTITVVVDGYMLIGALSMDVEVPDADESLNLFQRIIRAIKEFFQWIGSWFK